MKSVLSLDSSRCHALYNIFLQKDVDNDNRYNNQNYSSRKQTVVHSRLGIHLIQQQRNRIGFLAAEEKTAV